jgi:cytochrome c553
MKKFVVIGVLLGMGILVFVLLFTGPHMKNNPSFRKYEAVYNLPPEDAVPFRKPEKITLKLPEGNKMNIAAGKTYYSYYCVFCHGEDGKGNGPVGLSYVPKPANLRAPDYRANDSAYLYQVSFTGPGHSPVLERIVPPEWRGYIILYVRNEFINKR